MNAEQERTILQEAQERLKVSMEEDRENREMALEDLRFVAVEGAQWPENIRADRESNDRPCITTNKIPTYIDQVIGDQRMNRPSIKVIPVDSVADPKIATILGGWTKHVQQISSSDVAIDHGFEHAVACGYGAMRVVTKYVTDSSFDQEAYIEKIDNALGVYWGKHTKYDCSDAPYCFVISDISREEYKRLYDEDPMPFNSTDSQYVEGWSTKDTVRLAEYFVKEPTKKIIYQLTDGRIVDKLTEGDQVNKKRKVDSFTIKWYLLSGNKVLENTEWVGKKYIPVIPIWGKEFNVGGKRYLRGLIRNAKDPQRMYNYWQALSLKTPIPTPAGWLLLEDLEIGDKIFDDKGKICTVTNTSPIFENRDCVNVTFDDGSVITADVKHLWEVEERGKRTSKSFTWSKKVITSDELVPGKHFIYTPDPLRLSEKELPIPPYALGIWLGDGTSAEPNFTQNTSDMGEVSAYLKLAGCQLGPIKETNTAVNRTILNLRHKFIEFNLLFNKHIPMQYLRGSEQQRLELLQGLMDTDGSITSNTGQCSFTTTEPMIAVGFAELLRSLGIKAVYCSRDRRGHSSNYNGKSITAMKPVVQFSFTTRLPVFKLFRKLSVIGKAVDEPRRTKRYKIVSVTPTASVPVRCITVDSESSLYLAGISMIPTHNSIDTEVVALAPKAPYLVTPKQISGHETMWKQAHKKNYPYLLVNFDEKAPGWPKREEPPQASSAMVEKIQMADQEIRDTIGIQKAGLGMASNERSGAAIRERKMEGDVGTFAFIDNLSRSIEHLGRVLIDIAPGLLDTERIVRLGLDNGDFEFAEVNKEVDGKVFNDLSLGTYDVVVTVGPSFTTQRTEARQSMESFIQYFPQAAPLIGDLYAKVQDWPGADEFSQRLEFLLPPEIKAKKAEEAAKKAGAEVTPPTAAPAPPPDPVQLMQIEEGKLKLQELQIKVQQEEERLKGLQLENVLKSASSKEEVKRLVAEIMQEDAQGGGENAQGNEG